MNVPETENELFDGENFPVVENVINRVVTTVPSTVS